MNTSKTQKHILIVDDEEIHRMGLRDRLEASGYKVDSASSGEEALELVQANQYDLITLDLLMPQPNGFEVFKRLKELSVASRTPILLLTVVGLEPQVQTMLEEGAYFLQKQKAPTELVPTVRKLIRQGPGKPQQDQ